MRRVARLARSLCIGVFSSAAIASPARGQARSFVPPDAPVYADIDRLAAAGLIDTIVIGTRPYTEREIVRLLSEARRNLDRRPAATEWAVRAVGAGLRRYDRPGASVVQTVSSDVTFLDSPYRAIPADPNGSIDAPINPLAAYQGGRFLVNGTTGTLESLIDASLGPHVALSFQPHIALGAPRTSPSETSLRVQSGSLVLAFGNLVIDGGRGYLQFSQSSPSGLLLSGNAPPLDMIRVSTERPATLPWLFRALGPVYGTLFVADLGLSHQTHSHSKLAGYHLSLLPHRNVELGIEVIDETGGNGAPPGSFGDRIVDLFPVFDAFFRRNSDFQFSNKMAGLDARFRIPSLAGMELYAEGAVDDIDIRRFRSSLLEDGGIIGGISWTCLGECGRVVAKLEYHQTGIRYYTHTDFASGIEQQGTILGDPLGPRGLGGYASLDADAGRFGRIMLSGGHEVRSGNLYGSVASAPHLSDFHFVQVLQRPGEHRTRAMVTWRTGQVDSRLSTTLTLGAERVADADFVAGRNRTGAIGRVVAEWRP